MHAVVLAGGKGTRLRPYTTVIPKPLVPIGDHHSILDVILFQLADAGITKVWLPIGHLGHLIRSFVGDGSRWGLEVEVVEETSPLGTIGPLLPMLDRLPEQFLVMNGDILTDLDYADLLDHHREHGRGGLTVATYRRTTRIDFGVLEVESARITQFREKPGLDVLVSMGVYAISREALRRYEPGRPLGFDDLVLDMLDLGTPPASFRFDGFWLDIGRPEDYDSANADAETLLARLLPSGSPLFSAPGTATVTLPIPTATITVPADPADAVVVQKVDVPKAETGRRGHGYLRAASQAS